jgi:hypothetical protein
MPHSLRLILIAVGLFICLIGIIVLIALDKASGEGFAALATASSLFAAALMDASAEAQKRMRRQAAADRDAPEGAPTKRSSPRSLRD